MTVAKGESHPDLANAFRFLAVDRVEQAWSGHCAGRCCLMESMSQEAIDLAGWLKLGRLILLWDDNRVTIEGPTSLLAITDQAGRFSASGRLTPAADGREATTVARALPRARADPRPTLIAFRTLIGFGAPTRQGAGDARRDRRPAACPEPPAPPDPNSQT